jgi:hypothetical protein
MNAYRHHYKPKSEESQQNNPLKKNILHKTTGCFVKIS